MKIKLDNAMIIRPQDFFESLTKVKSKVHFIEYYFPVYASFSTQILKSLLLYREGWNSQILTLCFKKRFNLILSKSWFFFIYNFTKNIMLLKQIYSISISVALTFLLLQYIFSNNRAMFGFSLEATAEFNSNIL